MKNLLNYQSSEYDCAPVSVTNGIRYLFEREEIYPDMIKGVMIYGMDSYNDQGEPCKYGTSPACMEFMADWLTRFGQMHNFPISCHTVSGDNVALKEGSPVLDALEKGGAVALRLYLEVPHYVLATGVEDDCLLLFDPFYEDKTTVTLTFDDYVTVRALMVYNSYDYNYHWESIERVEMDFTRTVNGSTVTGTAYIDDLMFDVNKYINKELEGEEFMRPGGAAIAEFDELKVKEIRLTFNADAPIAISEIYVLGK